MMDGLGYIPTCSWCGKPINPTGQQLRRLKENLNIYCLEKKSAFFLIVVESKALLLNKIEKRNKKKKIVKQSNTIESLNDRKLKKTLFR